MTCSIQCVLHLLGRGLWSLGCLLLFGYGLRLHSAATSSPSQLHARGMCTGGGRSREEVVLKYQLPFHLSGSHGARGMVATCKSVLFPKYSTNKNTCSPHPLQQLNVAGMFSTAPDRQRSLLHANSVLPYNWMVTKSYVNKQFLALSSCSSHYKH